MQSILLEKKEQKDNLSLGNISIENATYLQNMENVVVIADEDAASKLTQSR